MGSRPESPSTTALADAARNKGATGRSHAILMSLLAIAALCWALLAWDYPSAEMDMTLAYTMGLSLTPFLVVWIVMMVAMMLPTAAPTILTFHAIQRRRTGRGAFSAT